MFKALEVESSFTLISAVVLFVLYACCVDKYGTLITMWWLHIHISL